MVACANWRVVLGFGDDVGLLGHEKIQARRCLSLSKPCILIYFWEEVAVRYQLQEFLSLPIRGCQPQRAPFDAGKVEIPQYNGRTGFATTSRISVSLLFLSSDELGLRYTPLTIR